MKTQCTDNAQHEAVILLVGGSVDVSSLVVICRHFHEKNYWKAYWNVYFVFPNSCGRSVGIAMGYVLDTRISILGKSRGFSTPQRPDRLCGPPNPGEGEFAGG
jgi:hypothetical protein